MRLACATDIETSERIYGSSQLLPLTFEGLCAGSKTTSWSDKVGMVIRIGAGTAGHV